MNLLSRRRAHSSTINYPLIVEALCGLPEDTVVDGEIDLLVFDGRDLTGLPLIKRRELLKSLKLDSGRIRIAEQFEARATDMLAGCETVRQQALEEVTKGQFVGIWKAIRLLG